MKELVSLEKLIGLGQAGQLSQAFNLLKQISKAKSDPEIWVQLSGIFGEQGDLEHCKDCCEKALAINPNFALAYSHLGNVFLSAGDGQKALSLSRHAVEIQPGDPVILYNFGVICRNRSRYSHAIQHLKRAIELRPDHAPSHYIIGSCYQASGQLDELVYHYNEALRLKPDFIDCLVNLGFHYTNIGEFDRAREYFDKALRINKHHSPALSGKAGVLLRTGDKAGAHQMVRQQIDAGNAVANTLYVYSLLGEEYGDPIEVIDLSERLLKQPQAPGSDRGLLGFAMGRVYDRLGKYDLAFKYYGIGNEATSDEYDIREFEAYIQSIIDMYSGEKLAALPSAGVEYEEPVFIVGMPRSGTSLIEQILSKHSRVFAAGELNDLAELTLKIPEIVSGCGGFPAGVDRLSSGQLDDLAKGHLGRLFELADGPVERIVDKLPSNYAYIGLIRQLFPKARIIHSMRDPRDTCLSVYFQNFQNFQRYAGDLDLIGEVYLQYRRLMDHWNVVLDVPILNVQYEDVVENAEEKAREIVEFCGLEWESDCLEFYQSTRKVITASFDQVNKPIYTKSVARWKNYEKHLGRLEKILAPVLT